MQHARNLWLDETAHETRTRTLLGKFVGQVSYFLHCIRNNLVAIPQLPEFVDGSDRFPSPVGQLDVHNELIEVELVLLLKIIGLVVIFSVGADAQPSDFDRRIEGKLKPRVLFLFLEVTCLPRCVPNFPSMTLPTGKRPPCWAKAISVLTVVPRDS